MGFIISNDGGWDRWGMVDSYQGVGGGTEGGCYLIVFLFVFLSFGLSYRLCFLEYDSCCVCFFVYYLLSLSLVPLTRSYWGIHLVVSVM